MYKELLVAMLGGFLLGLIFPVYISVPLACIFGMWVSSIEDKHENNSQN